MSIPRKPTWRGLGEERICGDREGFDPRDQQQGASMPLYDYECRRHGAFNDWRTISDCDSPVPCPVCGSLADRSISAPYLGIDSGLRKSHSINEMSAHEPRIVRRRRGDPIPHDSHRDLSRHRDAGSAHAHKHAGHSHGHEHGGGTAEVSKHPWLVRHH